jgi:hypothetical protein
MTRPAPRTIDEYLRQLREALAGEDPALIQDALYDAEEYLRAEIASQPGKSEGDVLELIASTYGAPDEVAAEYRENEAKVKAALHTPPATRPEGGAVRRFFGIFSDARAYTSVFYMLLALVTGERMPRRPVHPGAAQGWWARIGEMLRDVRTWTTLAYFVLMLPLGIAYFVIAVVGLALSLSGVFAPIFGAGRALGWIDASRLHVEPHWVLSPIGAVCAFVLGALLLTALMHFARSVTRAHVHVAKALLVRPGT